MTETFSEKPLGKIVHIVSDGLFIDSLMILMDRTNYTHEYVVLTRKKNEQPKRIKNLKRVTVLHTKGEKYRTFLKTLSEYNAVIIHNLERKKLKLIARAPRGTNFVWSIWGMDFYSLLTEEEYPLYGEKTKRYIVLSSSPFVNILKSFWRYYEKNKLGRRRKKIRDLCHGKINYFTTVIPEEELIVRKYLNIHIDYVPFSYGGTSRFIAQERYGDKVVSDNILIGNSAVPTNNHLEIFEMIRKSDLGKRKVIVPLSYGYAAYIKYISSLGERTFKESFSPLFDFLPMDDYYEMLQTCSVAIFGYYRQQGVANISLMLWLGARVYLSEKNPLLEFYKHLGVKIFSIEKELNKDISGEMFRTLEEDEINHNKKVLMGYYGKVAVIKRAVNFLNRVTQN